MKRPDEMLSVTSAYFQKGFGVYKRAAIGDPLAISIHGKKVLAVMSIEKYERILDVLEANGLIDAVKIDLDLLDIPSVADMERLNETHIVPRRAARGEAF